MRERSAWGVGVEALVIEKLAPLDEASSCGVAMCHEGRPVAAARTGDACSPSGCAGGRAPGGVAPAAAGRSRRAGGVSGSVDASFAREQQRDVSESVTTQSSASSSSPHHAGGAPNKADDAGIAESCGVEGVSHPAAGSGGGALSRDDAGESCCERVASHLERSAHDSGPPWRASSS